MDCNRTGLPDPHYLPEIAQIYVHWVSDAIQPSHSLSPLLLLPSIFPSIRVFSNESALQIRWRKYYSFSISPSNNIQSWFSLGLTGLFPCSPRDSQESVPAAQFESINSSVLSFLYGQLSHPYMTTGKTTALTRCTFVVKVTPLLFNTLSRFVIAFLPRSKHLLISQLQWFLSPRK